jgi:hypothetical protein
MTYVQRGLRTGSRLAACLMVALLSLTLATDVLAQRGGGRGGGRGGARGGERAGGGGMPPMMMAEVKARDGKELTLVLPNGRDRVIELPDNTRVSRMVSLELKKISKDDRISVSGPTTRTGGYKAEAARIEVLPSQQNVGPTEEMSNLRMLNQAQQQRSSRNLTVGFVVTTDPLKVKTERDRIYKVIISDETKIFKTDNAGIGDIEPGNRLRIVLIPGEKEGDFRGAAITIMPEE